jgi:hypothetical protein
MAAMRRFVLLVLIGCGGGGGDDDGACELGETQSCTCEGGSLGVQVCDGAGAFGACGMCGPVDPDPERINFQLEVVPILDRSCGSGNMACHARNQYAATSNMDCRGWLALENAALGSVFYSGANTGQPTGCPDKTLYQRLMTLQPWECDTGASYIKAGNASGSYVMNKIDGALFSLHSGAPSVQMPPADSTFRLSAADKAKLEQWIAEGALDN